MPIKRTKGSFEFDENMKSFKKFKTVAPKKVANQSLNHFLEGFKKGGFQTDASAGGWRKRKTKTKRNKGRAILVDTGALRRDLKKLMVSFSNITLGTTRIPYANRHNEGITDKLGRKMPEREFIGDSRKLNQKNVKLLFKLMNKVMKI